MKKILTLSLFLLSFSCYSQTINSKNYYDYFSYGKNLKGKKLTTAWVDKFEVAKILEEEMTKAGFEWIDLFRIIQISEHEYEYVNSICFSEKSKAGFLYEGSHEMFPKFEGRNIKSMYKKSTGNDYAEKIVKLNGESDFIKFKDIPNNLFIIKEDPYWYQYTENTRDNDILVTKNIILEILRNDIKEAIYTFKK